MTWLSRKLASLCARQGCTAEPCADHCLCAKHRAEHNARQRKVAKARRAWQARQVPLPLVR